MIRILQRQWTISSIIFIFFHPLVIFLSQLANRDHFGNPSASNFWFAFLSLFFLISASFEPLPTFFSLFYFSTDLTDPGPLREQNSQGGLWESKEVQQQTGHLPSSHSIFTALIEVPITRGLKNMCIVMTLCGCELNGTYS